MICNGPSTHCAGRAQITCRHRQSSSIVRCAAHPGTHQPVSPPSVIETDVRTGMQRSVGMDGGAVGALEGTVVTTADPLTAVRAFFLPRGWPSRVTGDYLRYQLWSFPTHITGWMSSALAGSSMLKALGLGAGPAGSVGFTAAIKWVTKDGVGAAGRLFVGGNLSPVFDEDPRRWRMASEVFGTIGLALEIATSLSPANFVLLAGAGTLAKATGRGMGRPCFRVIQTHFSATNNVGDVAAKEEVWEVTAQLLGLGASVALLTVLEAAGTPEAVVPLWAGIHAAHVSLRYLSLTQLSFPYLNMKRAAAVVSAYVAEGSVLSVEQANRGEAVLAPPESARPRCTFGCSVAEALEPPAVPMSALYAAQANSNGGSSVPGAAGGPAPPALCLASLLEVYKGERFVLTWRGGAAHVLLWEDAGPLDMLRALWQAAWLDASGERSSAAEELRASLAAMQASFPEFQAQAEAAGWQLEKTVLPLGSVRLQRSPS